MNEPASFDVCVIGSGPAGLNAARFAARAGRRVVVVEQEVDVGGACVHRGTIPSKTLRETALALANFRRRTADVFALEAREDMQVQSLMRRLESVVRAHSFTMGDTLRAEGIERWHGRASFTSSTEVEVTRVAGPGMRVRARTFVIATGSKPRTPSNVPIDHEHVLDSDSILSMTYLPESLTVLGGGVIACEYASIFAALGVRVTIVDSRPTPLGFLDPEIVGRFQDQLTVVGGGSFVGGRQIRSVEWDGVQYVRTELDDGTILESDKLLCCLGRSANLDRLNVAAAGIEADERGLLPVNEHLQTARPHIYAVGDVIGPPALASTSMDQGRRAMVHAFGLPDTHPPETIPVGIYTIPEMSSVGLSESEALKRYGDCRVGRAEFTQVARGHIADITEGLVKLVADPEGRRLLGVQIIGEGASELIHVGQMALLNRNDVDVFVDNTFNFPTLAEAYRVAALDILWARRRREAAVPPPVAVLSD